MMFGFFKKKQDPFTEKLFEHLKEREGYKQSVYLDILGKATCGIGHLLTKEEQEKYPVKSLVPKDVIDKWFEADVDTALTAAKKQAKVLGTDNDDIIIALVSVNYQLGQNWSRKFPKTWKLLCTSQKCLEHPTNNLGFSKIFLEFSRTFLDISNNILDISKIFLDMSTP